MAHHSTVPQDRYVVANGLRIHYLDWGSGDRYVICLHGSSGSCHVWDLFAASLLPDFRVLALDQRGHGDSDKPPTGYAATEFAQDLRSFVETLDIPKFDLVGVSLGSRASTVFAALYPDKLRHVVLVDASFDMSVAAQEEMLRNNRETPESFASIEEAVEHQMSRPMSKFRAESVVRDTVAKSLNQRADGRYEWKYRRDAVRQGLEHARDDLWPYAARIQAPTLIVRGAESHVLTRDSAKRMLDTFPNARLLEIPRSVHGIQQDNPEDFNREVRRFLLDEP